MHPFRLVLALELAFALLALLVLGRGLILGSRDDACLFASLALVLQGARLAVERVIGKAPPRESRAAQAQDDGQWLGGAGRCESDRDGLGEARRYSRPSAVPSDARGAECDDLGRCSLCGQDGPGVRRASVASDQCSPALHDCDGFKPCVLCGVARESQRDTAKAHEARDTVRELWSEQLLSTSQMSQERTVTMLKTGTPDEVARVFSPGPSAPPPAAPADQAGRGRDAHRRRGNASRTGQIFATPVD